MKKIFTLGLILSSICFNITDAIGQACSGTPATPTISSGVLSTQCAGATPTINANSNVGTTGNFFQWQSGSSATGPWSYISGATSLSYTSAALYSTTYFRIQDSCGISHSVSYSAAYQVPIDVFAISTQPSSAATCSGLNATFSVAASGTTLAYQWYVNQGSGYVALSNGGVYNGATTATLTITGATAGMNNYSYECAVSDACNPATYSGAAVLTVNASPTITTAPADVTACNGSNATFSIVASGANITYQWQLNTGSGYAPVANGGIYSGATTSSLSITGVSNTLNGYSYRCVLTSSPCTAVISTGATLTITNLPAITTQPGNDTICSGNNGIFSTTATGSGISYQWQVNTGSGFVNASNGVLYSGATTNTLSITNATIGMNGYLYQCVVTGSCSPAATTNAALLSITQSPSITSQPVNDTICAASGATYSITAIGGGLTYQWQVNTGSSYVNVVNGGVYSGATTSTLNITGATAGMNGYLYRCIATSGSCSAVVTSNGASLIVYTASAVTFQPQNSTICQGASTSFFILASGSNLSYQWMVNQGSGFVAVANGGVYSGATSSTLIITAATAGMSGYIYQCVVSNSKCTSASSNSATLTVNPTLVPSIAISANPGTTICAGTSVTFTAVPTNGGTTPAYQWKLNGVNVGSNSNTYTNAAPGNGNTVTCTLTSNATCASPSVANSNVLTMTVNPVLVPTVSIAANPGTTICSGTSVIFTPTPVNGGTSPIYQWKLNGTLVSIGNTYTNAALANGNTVSCTLTSNATCANPTIANSNVLTMTVNALPTATITAGGPTTFCTGGSVVLTATAGSGISYQWYVNSSIIVGATSQAYTANASGSYQVKITNTTTLCNATSAATVVTVNALPTANISASGSVNFCLGGSVTLTASSGASYAWQLNGLPITGATSQNYVVTVSGTYKVTVTNAAGCSATSTGITVTVNPLPAVTLTLSGPTTFCAGGSVTISVPLVAGTTYQWYKNFVAIPGAISSSYAANSTGNYYVKVITTVTTCTANSANTVVTVNALPVPVITANGPISFCAGGNVSMTATPTGSGITYAWQMNGSAIPGATSSSYSATASGNYTCMVTNGNNCTGTSNTIAVNVNPLPTQPVISNSGPTEFCQGGSVYLSTFGVIGINYQWSLNSSAISGATATGYAASTAGNYTISATDDSACSSTSFPITVIIDTLPAAPLIGALGPTTFCWGSTVTLTSATILGVTYQWYDNNNTVIGAISPFYPAPDTGNYTLIITDGNGCTATSNGVYLSADFLDPVITASGSMLCTGTFPSYQWYFNGTAITSGGNSSCYTPAQNGAYWVVVSDSICSATSSPYYLSTLGVGNVMSKDDIKIYPNPASSVIHIAAPGKVNVTIAGIDGKVFTHMEDAHDIDISQLPNGMYMVMVYDSNNVLVRIDKLIKSN